MGSSGIGKPHVSKLCKDIERVHGVWEPPLAGKWPHLRLDATYLKQPEGGRSVSVAAIIAAAVNTDGRREIVGLRSVATKPDVGGVIRCFRPLPGQLTYTLAPR